MVSKTIGWEFESLHPCISNTMTNKIQSFIIGCILEIRHKVTWPSYKSLQDSSILVLVVLVIFALVIGAIDLSFRKVFGWVYSIF